MTMELNKLKEVETPYKLSEVLGHFDLSEEHVYSVLNNLVEEQRIFAHDIRRTDGEYFLSQYALVSLITNIEISEDSMLKLDSFLKGSGGNVPVGEYLARLKIALHKTLLEFECYKIKYETEGVKSEEGDHLLQQCFGDSIH